MVGLLDLLSGLIVGEPIPERFGRAAPKGDRLQPDRIQTASVQPMAPERAQGTTIAGPELNASSPIIRAILGLQGPDTASKGGRYPEAPMAGMPMGRQGEIRKGPDGKSYQYIQLNGDVGGNGEWGWRPVNVNGLQGSQPMPGNYSRAPQITPPTSRGGQQMAGGLGGGGFDFKNVLAALGPAIAMIDPRNASLGANLLQMQQGKRKDAQQQNRTVNYLISQGMSPDEAATIASDPALFRAWYGERMGGDLDRRYKEAQIKNIESEIAKRNDPNARNQFGNSIIWGQKDDGTWVAMQPSSGGGLVAADVDPSIKLSPPGVGNLDLGTQYGIRDRAGNVINTVEKDLAGAEQQKAVGKATGEAAFDLPRVEQNAAQTLQVIDALRNHPGRGTGTGMSSTLDPRNYFPGTDATNFRVMREQALGKVFLEAYATLKGGGQITEVEGQKAQDAIARLNTAQSDEAFLTALDDFEQVVKIGLDRARKQAGAQGAAPSAPSGQRLRFNPATGDFE